MNTLHISPNRIFPMILTLLSPTTHLPPTLSVVYFLKFIYLFLPQGREKESVAHPKGSSHYNPPPASVPWITAPAHPTCTSEALDWTRDLSLWVFFATAPLPVWMPLLFLATHGHLSNQRQIFLSLIETGSAENLSRGPLYVLVPQTVHKWVQHWGDHSVTTEASALALELWVTAELKYTPRPVP